VTRRLVPQSMAIGRVSVARPEWFVQPSFCQLRPHIHHCGQQERQAQRFIFSRSIAKTILSNSLNVSSTFRSQSIHSYSSLRWIKKRCHVCQSQRDTRGSAVLGRMRYSSLELQVELPSTRLQIKQGMQRTPTGIFPPALCNN